MVKAKNGDFKKFYETSELLNKGLIINGKEIMYRSKMSHAISKNLRKLEPDCNSIKDTLKKLLKEPSAELKTVQIKYAKKDKDQQPMMVSDEIGIKTYDIAEEKKKIFDQEVKKIEEKFKKEFDEKNDFLDTEDEFDIHVVDNENFPDLPQYIADALYPMRKEE